jgi:amino acid adenylation domain-containing protein
LFEHRVEETPQAVAVVCEGQRLSYQELNQRANDLAWKLRNLGVASNTLVGLYAEPSLELVIGVLGILKAGGAYVPLDPTYPRARLELMVEEAKASVLVTQRHLTKWFRGTVVGLDNNKPLGRGLEENMESPKVSAGELAYVIFTSGSTGKPKGVRVSHHNVVRLFRSTHSWFGFDANDVWTLFHSLAFDFSVWELWGALIYGGRLLVVPHTVRRSPRAFYELLRSEQVTVLNQTPSAFRQLMHHEESAAVADGLALRLVILGGEALALPTLKPWFKRHGDQHPRLVNMYGITETTVHVTYRPITQADLNLTCGSVIGRPVLDLQVHLLDSDRRPVPEGEVGEMYIGGEGVALGYLGQPELTEERFLSDPFRENASAQLYKSGDLARRLPDGDLVYMGRIDHQVKIRGFRIELLEIESLLCRHDNVREAAVLARQDFPDEKRLVAYVVARYPPAPTVSELRSFLAHKLPEYMVPAAFVFLDSLPTTTNGKLDRDQLPAPAPDRPEVQASYLPPQDDCAQRLQEIWQNLLHLNSIGIRDNFFELGGDSLLAVRLELELRKSFGWDLPPAILLEEPTIEHLAKAITGQHERIPSASVVPIQTKGENAPFFCVHPIEGWVYGYRLLAKYLPPDRPFYALQARELHYSWEPFKRLEDLAAFYLKEALKVQPQGPYFLGGYSFGAFVAFEMAQQLHQKGHTVAFLGMIDDGPSLCHGKWTGITTELPYFLANMPRWLIHRLARKKPSTLISGAGRKLKDSMRRLVPGRTPVWIGLERYLDLSRFSERDRKRLIMHYQALMNYSPRKYPGRITVFRARTQPLWGSHQPDLGWGQVTGKGVNVHIVPGDHSSLLEEPNVRALSARLAEALSAAR